MLTSFLILVVIMLTSFSNTANDTNRIDIASPEDAITEVLNQFSTDDGQRQQQEDNIENEHLDDPEEEDEEDADDEHSGDHYEKISKMYIKDRTRGGYNSSNRLLLLWLDAKILNVCQRMRRRHYRKRLNRD